MADKRKGRKPWDRTQEAQAYRTQYVKDHYTTLTVLVPLEDGEAYKAACKSAGVTYSKPLQDTVNAVISGKYKL